MTIAELVIFRRKKKNQHPFQRLTWRRSVRGRQTKRQIATLTSQSPVHHLLQSVSTTNSEIVLMNIIQYKLYNVI